MRSLETIKIRMIIEKSLSRNFSFMKAFVYGYKVDKIHFIIKD